METENGMQVSILMTLMATVHEWLDLNEDGVKDQNGSDQIEGFTLSHNNEHGQPVLHGYLHRIKWDAQGYHLTFDSGNVSQWEARYYSLDMI